MLIFIFIALVLIVVGAAMIFYGKKWGAKAARMAETPTTPINVLQPGFREIKGAIKCGDDALKSPMGRKPCVYFHFKVEEETERGTGKDRRKQWITVLDDRQFAPCIIDDGTGEADINLEEADLEVASDTKRERKGFFDNVDDRHADYLQRSFRALSSMSFSRQLRYTEEVLEENEEVYVIGTATLGENGRYSFNRGEDMFVVSDHGEEGLARSMKFRSIGLYVLAGLFFIGAVVTIVFGASASNKPADPAAPSSMATTF